MIVISIRSSKPAFSTSMYAFVKATKKVPVRKDFKEILPSITVIWIQLCHYSRLLCVNEGMLNTLMIRLQNELLFSQSSPCLNLFLSSAPSLRSHTRGLWIQEIKLLMSRQAGPHLTFDLTMWLTHGWWLNTDTHKLTATQGSCSCNIFKLMRQLATV